MYVLGENQRAERPSRAGNNCEINLELGPVMINGKSTCVLLIEDDLLDAELVRRAMKCMSFKYELTWCRTLTESLQLAQDQTFDIVLADLSLPDSFGNETLDRLRDSLPLIPIVVLTSSIAHDLAATILDSGAQDYIPKEAISSDVLGRAIRHAIQRNSLLLESENLFREIYAARELLAVKNKKLEQLYTQAHDFVDNVSHEFRTPLTVINEYSSLIREGFVGVVNAEQVRMLDIVENRVDDLNTMVDDMLDSSKLEAGLIGVSRRPSAVQEVLAQVLSTIERKAQIKEVELRCTVAADLPELYCDVEKIGRVLVNLAVNALKFCGNPGEVRFVVDTNECGNDVSFSVEDNGPGIDAENLQQIFERFRQLGTSTHTSCKGFGLGLAIAKDLVELNFGSLSVTSTRGKGSTFSFTVPANNPRHVMGRYLEYIKRSQVTPHFVTLVSASAGTDHDSEMAQSFEDFLNLLCRCNDLVFCRPQDSFLLVLPTDEIELQNFLDRGQQLWKNTNRNCPNGPLPLIQYDCLGTWRIDQEHSDLMKTVEELTHKGQAIGV